MHLRDVNKGAKAFKQVVNVDGTLRKKAVNIVDTF
jgi:hypothetical protein